MVSTGGATCHTAKATLDVLRPVFEERVISRRADVVWPPRNCDLTLLDYYLWGAVKDKCYANKPEIIDILEDKICEAISEIQLHTIDNELKNWTYCMASRGNHLYYLNWTDRIGYCIASRGSHLNEIICRY